MNSLILAAALLGAPQCAGGQCAILPAQPVRTVVRAVTTRQPVRTFFRSRRPVRRLVGAVLRPRCCR